MIKAKLVDSSIVEEVVEATNTIASVVYVVERDKENLVISIWSSWDKMLDVITKVVNATVDEIDATST